MIYQVAFILDKLGREENFEADNPGEAFALALKRYPEAKLLKASAYGNFGIKGLFCAIHYDAPPVQRPLEKIRTGPRKPKRKEAHEELGLE